MKYLTNVFNVLMVTLLSLGTPLMAQDQQVGDEEAQQQGRQSAEQPAPVEVEKERPFEKEILAFEQQDSVEFPPKGAIVFTGSSSIRMWKDLKERFEGYAIIQRGFGGSQLSDVIYYADRILIPYRPSKVFVYAGDNDLAAGQSADEVFEEFMEFHALMTDSLPYTDVYFIAAKPSPSRQHLLPEYEAFNNMVADFISEQAGTWQYVDVFNAMLDDNGVPMGDLFLEDRLHMNSKGYDIWEELISKYL